MATVINYRRFGRKRLLRVRETELATVFGPVLQVKNFEITEAETVTNHSPVSRMSLLFTRFRAK